MASTDRHQRLLAQAQRDTGEPASSGPGEGMLMMRVSHSPMNEIPVPHRAAIAEPTSEDKMVPRIRRWNAKWAERFGGATAG